MRTIRCLPLAVALASILVPAAIGRAADPESTIRAADQTLREVMSMSGGSIPQSLLAEAQGVVIIPDCIKVGFVVAGRRGHGVVVVRSPNGGWSVPQFVTLTGGSLGWQAGVQGTDVVLVFTTQKSIEGLLKGKFTIGADAAVAAGPVGRNASAATDARLKAEILSYSRSRGLFAGVSLDGSAIEIDSASQSAYFGTAAGAQPASIPPAASQFLSDLEAFSKPPVPGAPGAPPAGGAGPQATQPVMGNSPTRQNLAASAESYSAVDPRWQSYLALPGEIFQGTSPPKMASIEAALKQYDTVAGDPKYKALTDRGEFRATHSLLREYARELAMPTNSATSSATSLPAPPSGSSVPAKFR